MDQVMDIRATQRDEFPNPSMTLDEARERIRALLRQSEENAWEIGDLLNTIEKQGLARREGYGKTRTWLETEVPEVHGKTSTLYRYAHVAAVYTKQQVHKWGITKLELLMAHDKDVLGHSNPEEPANRDVQLLRPDGSTVIKKFHDCSYRDLQLSNQFRSKAQRAPGHKKAARHSKVHSLRSSSSESTSSRTEVHSFRVAFAMMALGIILAGMSPLLPTGIVSVWILIAAGGFFLGGIGILIQRWHNFHERLLSAVKEGKALEFLKEQLDNVARAAQRVTTAIRSRTKSTNAPTTSPEEAPPNEKKAA